MLCWHRGICWCPWTEYQNKWWISLSFFSSLYGHYWINAVICNKWIISDYSGSKYLQIYNESCGPIYHRSISIQNIRIKGKSDWILIAWYSSLCTLVLNYDVQQLYCYFYQTQCWVKLLPVKSPLLSFRMHNAWCAPLFRL